MHPRSHAHLLKIEISHLSIKDVCSLNIEQTNSICDLVECDIGSLLSGKEAVDDGVLQTCMRVCNGLVTQRTNTVCTVLIYLFARYPAAQLPLICIYFLRLDEDKEKRFSENEQLSFICKKHKSRNKHRSRCRWGEIARRHARTSQ